MQQHRYFLVRIYIYIYLNYYYPKSFHGAYTTQEAERSEIDAISNEKKEKENMQRESFQSMILQAPMKNTSYKLVADDKPLSSGVFFASELAHNVEPCEEKNVNSNATV